MNRAGPSEADDLGNIDRLLEERDQLSQLRAEPLELEDRLPPGFRFGSVEEQLTVIRRGIEQTVTEPELAAKLKASAESGRPLRIKYGIDPTAVDVHLGHTVPLRKLRQFQELGHQAVIIIGDATALVGDPSGRDETRPQLTPEQVRINAEQYRQQLAKIVDLDRAHVVYNSQWFGRMGLIWSRDEGPGSTQKAEAAGVGFIGRPAQPSSLDPGPSLIATVLDLASRISVARLLERDDFSERIKAGRPIYLHECLYPLMQGYDSVMVRADVELGATEQLFNLLVGRRLQRDAGQEPQVCITLPILVGTDGSQRMGKSLGNYIGISEPAGEMFGRVMSLPDHCMRQYYELLTDRPAEEIERLLGPGTHPKEAKAELAKDIVTQYWSRDLAEHAAEEFERVFARDELPSSVTDQLVSRSQLEFKEGKVWLPQLLKAAGLVSSTSSARRLIQQRAVRIGDDRRVVADFDTWVVPEGLLISIGKRQVCRIQVVESV